MTIDPSAHSRRWPNMLFPTPGQSVDLLKKHNPGSRVLADA